MGGVEECGRAGGVWWEGRRSVGGWRGVGGLEECSGRVEECGGKGKLCARAFKHNMCIPEKVFAAIGVWEGVRHVGGVEVCGTVLKMGQ